MLESNSTLAVAYTINGGGDTCRFLFIGKPKAEKLMGVPQAGCSA
jgi:hypothetical protein